MSVPARPSAPSEDHRASSGKSRTWPEHLAAAGFLAGFVALLFYPLLFTDRVLASGDILHYFYPYRDYAAAALRTGRIPLWNPYIFAGAPFLANPQAAVLYPLHWPLLWLPAPQQIYWSGALHAWILGMGGYALLRRWGAGWAGGLVAGLVLAGSGFYGGLLGHINQMNGAAWLPWLLWILVGAARTTRDPAWRGQDLLPAVLVFALLVALEILAGHTQTAYINLFGVGLWLLGRTILHVRATQGATHAQSIPGILGIRVPLIHIPWTLWGVYILGGVWGGILAGAQILPTLELSGLGLRSGGLSYGEATSFSLRPLLLPWTLLPSYGLRDLSVVFGTLGYTEYVAYVGLVGLILALIALVRGRSTNARTPAWWAGVILAGAGFLLALGRWNPLYYLLYALVPGFDLFRAPARWMMLYTLGMAILAGLAADSIRLRMSTPRRASLFTAGLTLLVAVDLLLAAQALPHTHPTAPQAVSDVRTAPAHLLTDPTRSLHPGAMSRFLSMSPTTFDPGDMPDWRRIFRESEPPVLDEAAFQEFIIALKSQEILAPNLSLLWRIPALDGFDGGVLPLQRYIRFLTLFVPPEQLVPDGRLREQVRQIPPARLLALADVGYVITDKVRDLWFQGVYYDREIGVHLSGRAPSSARVDVDRPFQASHIGLIGYVDGPVDALPRLAQGRWPVLRVAVTGPCPGPCPTWTVTAGGQAGADLADGRLDSPLAAAAGATVAYRDVEGGRQEYRVLLPLDPPLAPQAITLTRLPNLPEWTVVVRAITLIDARTGTFQPLLPSDRGAFRRVHSGDVKIYAPANGPGRTWLASCVTPASSVDEALAWLSAPDMDPRRAVVEGWPDPETLCTPSPGRATLLAYAPERVEIQVEAPRPGLLVLADAYYPGWEAWVDGQPAPIYPTNVLFRGIPVEAGSHRVVLVYRPASWRLGLGLSGVGWILWGLAWPVYMVWPRRKPD